MQAPTTGGTSVIISQEQSARVTTAARTEISIAIRILQQAIAEGQAVGGNVRLRLDLLQALLVRVQAAVRQLAAARILQQQSASVVVGGTQAAAAQRQIVEALSAAEAQLNFVVATVQRLIGQARASGGVVTISLAAAQQLLASLQVSLNSVAQAEAAQRQLIGVFTGGAAPFPGFPSPFGGGFPTFPTTFPTASPFGTALGTFSLLGRSFAL